MTRCESYPPCFGTIYFPTAPLQLLITVTLINVIFFSITQTRQYCSVMSYYRQTIELNQDLNQILQDTNQLEEEILSKIR